jgi:hypothetical protein
MYVFFLCFVCVITVVISIVIRQMAQDLRNLCISFVMSVCMKQPRSQWINFCNSLYWGVLLKSVVIIQFALTLLFHSSSSLIILTRLSGSRSRPTTSQKIR